MRLVVTTLAILATASALGAGVPEMARAGQWDEVLKVARLRSDQLPLTAEEAMVAAYAARRLGDRAAEERFLARAASGSGLEQVAAVELAELTLDSEPDGALTAVLPRLRRAETPQLRAAAVAVAAGAVGVKEVEVSHRRAVDRARSGLPRSLRRELELALAISAPGEKRQRLARLLGERSGDQAALTAARTLAMEHDLTALEQWRVARAYYRHALYSESEPLLEGLADVQHRSISSWEVLFLRGRCAFRVGRWDEASGWYRRAIARTNNRERKAELEVHLGRALELLGLMDEAIAAAQRAVRAKTTDDRRLFLARLRLRSDEPELAAAGLDRLRGRQARERGKLMMALHDLRAGRAAAAAGRLEAIRRKPWRGPAAVLAAEISVQQGRWNHVLELLEGAAPALDRFWAARARRVMGEVPAEQEQAWRKRVEESLKSLEGAALRRRLGVWAVLETESPQLEILRHRVQRAVRLDSGVPPAFPPGLAGRLWSLGLLDSALRWHPGGLPKQDAAATLWSAEALAQRGLYWRAISAADEAWRRAGAELPMRIYPRSLREVFDPLPDAASVRGAGAEHAVPWNLVAGVARQESKWNPSILSRAGARGLMQLMPATARAVALRLELDAPDAEQLYDPDLSLALGAAELGRLLQVFDGRWAPAAAAYNAGETQARQWLDLCGAGCDDGLYVLNISFSETRSYAAQVLAAAAAYEELY